MLKQSDICKKSIRTFVISIFIFSLSNLYAQTYNQELFTYVSPKPNSKNNSISNNIIISISRDVNIPSVLFNSLIKVKGKTSGNITGRILIKPKTIIFMPDNNFVPGDEIKVDFSEFGRLLGDFLSQNTFIFSVSENSNLLTSNVIDEI